VKKFFYESLVVREEGGKTKHEGGEEKDQGEARVLRIVIQFGSDLSVIREEREKQHGGG